MPDEEVDAYIPIETAKERYGNMNVKMSGGNQMQEMVELHEMIVEIDSDVNVEATAAGIESMLKQFHKKEDYKISVPLALLRQAQATKRTFNIVLGSIAAISLLVGGIGIMNIMLASVAGILLALKSHRDGFVREVGRGYDVRDLRPGFARRARRLGEVDLEERAVPAGELTNGIDGLDRRPPRRPAAADAARQGQHGDTAAAQERLAQRSPRVASRGEAHVVRARTSLISASRPAGGCAPARSARRAGRRAAARAGPGRSRSRAGSARPLDPSADRSPWRPGSATRKRLADDRAQQREAISRGCRAGVP